MTYHPPPVLYFYEWTRGDAVPDEEMNGASVHVESSNGITPTRSDDNIKAKGHDDTRVIADSKQLRHKIKYDSSSSRDGSNAVAAIKMAAEVPDAHERAVSIALLESLWITAQNLCHKVHSWTQIEPCHLEHIVGQPQLQSTISRKVARKVRRHFTKHHDSIGSSQCLAQLLPRCCMAK